MTPRFPILKGFWATAPCNSPSRIASTSRELASNPTNFHPPSSRRSAWRPAGRGRRRAVAAPAATGDDQDRQRAEPPHDAARHRRHLRDENGDPGRENGAHRRGAVRPGQAARAFLNDKVPSRGPTPDDPSSALRTLPYVLAFHPR